MEIVTSHQQTQCRAAGELFKLGVFSLKSEHTGLHMPLETLGYN